MSMRLFVWFSLLACLFPVISAAAPPAPVSLRVEYLTSPLGIDVAQPRFSWVLPQDGRGQKQTAYQVVVCRKTAEGRSRLHIRWWLPPVPSRIGIRGKWTARRVRV